MGAAATLPETEQALYQIIPIAIAIKHYRDCLCFD